MITQLLVPDGQVDAALPRLISALGVDFSACPLEHVIGQDANAERRDSALILSESQLITADEIARSRQQTLREALSSYRQILIYPFRATPEGLRSLEHLVEANIKLADLPNKDATYTVHGSREICGAFTGLQFGTVSPADRPLEILNATHETDVLVSAGDGALLAKFKLPQFQVYLISSAAVFDVTAIHYRNLVAADCFSGLVPLLFYIRHCGIPYPQSTFRWANWVIDDPNLKPRYGFININSLAECVSRIGAAATIGFIPWNYKRTSDATVALFRKGWPRLSICVHGCDHTQSEFSTRTISDATRLAALAMERMKHLEVTKSLGYEKVMVFPQGKFSAVAMDALRNVDLLAAVNTELADAHSGEGVTGAQLLQPAITSYSGFPLFLRRPPEEPIANFALDLLLGKPCLVVTHHEYFQSGMQPLCAMVEALNRLEPAMVWTSLETGVLATASLRTNVDGTANVRLFGARANLHLATPGDRVVFTKLERPNADTRVLWNGRSIPSSSNDDTLTFTGEGRAQQNVKIEISMAAPHAGSFGPASTRYRLKVAARRYLSEFRDNYIDCSPRMKAGITAVRKLAARAS